MPPILPVLLQQYYLPFTFDGSSPHRLTTISRKPLVPCPSQMMTGAAVMDLELGAPDTPRQIPHDSAGWHSWALDLFWLGINRTCSGAPSSLFAQGLMDHQLPEKCPTHLWGFGFSGSFRLSFIYVWWYSLGAGFQSHDIFPPYDWRIGWASADQAQDWTCNKLSSLLGRSHFNSECHGHWVLFDQSFNYSGFYF